MATPLTPETLVDVHEVVDALYRFGAGQDCGATGTAG